MQAVNGVRKGLHSTNYGKTLKCPETYCLPVLSEASRQDCLNSQVECIQYQTCEAGSGSVLCQKYSFQTSTDFLVIPQRRLGGRSLLIMQLGVCVHEDFDSILKCAREALRVLTLHSPLIFASLKDCTSSTWKQGGRHKCAVVQFLICI